MCVQAECVGFIDSEIRGMSWSPDYELMILVTGNRTILSMTQEWEIVTEVPLQDEPQVGGCTQPSRELCCTPHAHRCHVVQAQTKADDDEGAQPNLPSLSWRGDGNYFVVNSLDADGTPTIQLPTLPRGVGRTDCLPPNTPANVGGGGA